MEIKEYITQYNHKNGRTDSIKYIVIHYVGATGGALANCKYYAQDGIGSSAHYFVDFDGTIYRSVRDEDTAWHCGAKSYVHPECRNANSIGIEMCVRNKGSMSSTSKDWYFEDATVAQAIELTKYLMDKYNVPADHVIRHYDVTGKMCGNPYVYNHTKHTWQEFKDAIEEKHYVPGWYLDHVGWWYAKDTEHYARNEWQDINGCRYYFNDAGYAVKGEQTIDGKKYLFESEPGHPKECALMITDNAGAHSILCV